MTDLDRIILNFLNENKLYPTNIVNNLTKKLGDSSNETLNKLAIFGLFRQAPPFNTIKDINQLSSLDQLNDLFDKWKESALQQLVGSRGELKGNKTASMTYLDAYVDNITSLGNNAKPFSYKDVEQTLIDVCNNNSWIKQDNVAAQTHGVEKPHDSDIMFEDDNITILKAPNKAKCIMYGKGYSWCISQTNLNYYNHYRIKNGASIYFVLNKKLGKEDKERVCVILRYSGDKYGIADKTNSGQRSGGPDVAGQGFSYVEGELPWLSGKNQYFPENPVTESEREYEAAVATRYNGDDLGNYIINKSKELKFNGDDIDPSDFLRDYLIGKNISYEQFASLTEPMKVQLVEMGFNLNGEMIFNLSSTLKVRYAVIRLLNNSDINFTYYSDEEIDRVLNNIKDKLNDNIINRILRGSKSEQRYGLVKQILSLIKDRLNTDIITRLLDYVPNDEKRYELINQILLLVKDKLNGNIISNLLHYYPFEKKYELLDQLFLLTKNKLTYGIIDSLLDYTTPSRRYYLIKQIIPLVKNIHLNSRIIELLLSYTQPEDKEKVQSLIDKYKPKDVVNELRLIVRDILKENY